MGMGTRMQLPLSEVNNVYVRLKGLGWCAKRLVYLSNSGPDMKLLQEQNLHKHMACVFQVRVTTTFQ